MESKIYIVTRQQCENDLSVRGFVCSGCGGKLSAIETVDNADQPTHWPGCETCCNFDYGVPQLVFDIANKLVRDCHHVQYSHLQRPDGKEQAFVDYWYASQIRGTSSLVSNVLRLEKEFKSKPVLKTGP